MTQVNNMIRPIGSYGVTVCVYASIQGKKHREVVEGDKALKDEDRAALIDRLDDMGWNLDKKSLTVKSKMMLANGETPKEWKEFLSEAIEAPWAQISHPFNEGIK